MLIYTECAGLEIPVHLCIASPFSRQIANGNAGPATALESEGAELLLPLFKYWSNAQTVSKNTYCLGPQKSIGPILLLRIHDDRGGTGHPSSAII